MKNVIRQWPIRMTFGLCFQLEWFGPAWVCFIWRDHKAASSNKLVLLVYKIVGSDCILCISFSGLTLLAGRQEGDWGCIMLGVGLLVATFDWSFARVIAPVVTTTKITGDILLSANPGPPVIFQSNLKMDSHVHYIISQCAQRMYLLKLLQHQGMSGEQLSVVTYSIIISRILYALPAWGGFLSAELANKINALFRRLKRFGYSVRFDRHLWSWSFPQILFIWAFSASFATAREKYSNLRNHGHPYELPEYCTNVHKKSFIIRSLYFYIWFFLNICELSFNRDFAHYWRAFDMSNKYYLLTYHYHHLFIKSWQNTTHVSGTRFHLLSLTRLL